MATTLVGMFDDLDAAQHARTRLTQAGISDSMIQLTAAQGAEGTASGSMPGTGKVDHRGFFARLFGLDEPDDDANLFAEGVRRGSSVVTVTLPDESLAESAIQILEETGAIDVDQRLDQWKTGGYQAYDEQAPGYTADQVAQERQTFNVMQEDLKVGT